MSEKRTDGMNMSVRGKPRDGGGAVYEIAVEKAGDDLIRRAAQFDGFPNPGAWILDAIALRIADFAAGQGVLGKGNNGGSG